jgi:hypothetical protein
MALSLGQVFARSAWRLRAAFNGGDPTGQPASAFVVARADGGPCTVTAAHVIGVDGTAVELSLSEKLLPRIVYTLTWGATTLRFSFVRARATDRTIQPSGEDPEAEVFGVEPAWFSKPLGPDGDFQRRRGIECLKYDLPNRAMLRKNELAQDPTAGGNLIDGVNGPAGRFVTQQLAADLATEFRRDDRVRDAAIDPVVSPDGEVDFNSQVQTRAAGGSVSVRSS